MRRLWLVGLVLAAVLGACGREEPKRGNVVPPTASNPTPATAPAPPSPVPVSTDATPCVTGTGSVTEKDGVQSFVVTITNFGGAPATGVAFKWEFDPWHKGVTPPEVLKVPEGVSVDKDGFFIPLGTLLSGTTREVRFELKEKQVVDYPTGRASVACDGQKWDWAYIKSRYGLQTGMPAVVLTVVASPNEIRVGDLCAFEISVRNQGNRIESNVRSMVTFPPGFEFVEGSGDTAVSATGQRVTLAPVACLCAKKEHHWRLKARCVKAVGIARVMLETSTTNYAMPITEIEMVETPVSANDSFNAAPPRPYLIARMTAEGSKLTGTILNAGDATATNARVAFVVQTEAKNQSVQQPPGSPVVETTGPSMLIGDLPAGAERSFTLDVPGVPVTKHGPGGRGELLADNHAAIDVAYAGKRRSSRLGPAIVVELIDEPNPHFVGEEIIFTIVVRNQGAASDADVRATFNVTDSFELRSVSGSTPATVMGSTITFETAARLDPKQELKWRVVTVCRATKGDIRPNLTVRTWRNAEPITEILSTCVAPEP